MILKMVVPKLLALVLKLAKLDITEVDVQAVLDLLKEIKLILAAVEACVGELVAALEAGESQLLPVKEDPLDLHTSQTSSSSSPPNSSSS